jgi:heme/copper-type cytochrome/quinol oxidase subunit 2
MTDPNQPNPQNTPPAPPAYESQAYGNAPQYNAGPPAGGSAPGRTMGIVALILAIVPFTQLIGLILGIVALVQSRKAGAKNGMAVAAIIVAAILLVISIIVVISLIAFAASVTGDLTSLVNTCLEDPSGSVTYQGVDLTCEELLQNY